MTTDIDAAWGLLQQERFGEAISLASRILGNEPANVSAMACRAMARWRAEGDNALSIAELRRAVEIAPDVAPLRHNLGMLLTSAGDLEAAIAQYETALRLRPDDAMAFWGLTLNRKFDRETDLIRSMVDLHASGRLPQLQQEFISFGLAKVFDNLGAADRAMGYAIEANRLGARPWDRPAAERALAQLAASAHAGRYRALRRSGHPSRAPLFIVGMLRSGTTLVETMLSRHPAVLALGESDQVPILNKAARARRMATGLPPDAGDPALDVDRDWLNAQAEILVKSWMIRSGTPFDLVTDKLPDNAFHLGLIKRLFPSARVIYLRRHPLDVGVSNFFQRYSAGHGFSNRLDWIGSRIRLVSDTMAVWKRALDLEILDVRYESLVTDPEAELRRITEFAGLSWADEMLSPERSMRRAGTASQWQVRQPIYRSSIGHWQAYERWLGPMIDAMGGQAWIDREMAGVPAVAATRRLA